jgi:hypothetical protein
MPASAFNISSVMPSEKYSWSTSPLILTNGKTAIVLATSAPAPTDVSRHKIGNCDSQHADDGEIQLAAGEMSDRFAAIDILLFFDAFRGELESPCENDRHGKTDDQQQQDDLEYPGWGPDIIEDDIGHLEQQPRDDGIGNPHADDIASF